MQLYRKWIIVIMVTLLLSNHTIMVPYFSSIVYAQVAEPSVQSGGAIIIEADSGRVLYEKNPDTRYYPASITKILTALLVIEHSNLDSKVVYSRSATTNLESGAVTLGVRAGDRISVRDSLYGLLLKSANEVANGLAEHISGSIPAFAELMNQRARSVGATNSNFANPSGLNHPNHYTTARDMTKIAREAFSNKTFQHFAGTVGYYFPAIQSKSSKTWITMGHKMLHRGDPRYYDGVIGGKTGYTSKAGNTLVTCAIRNGKKIIAVILSARGTHYKDTRAMLDYGFAKLEEENKNSALQESQDLKLNQAPKEILDPRENQKPEESPEDIHVPKRNLILEESQSLEEEQTPKDIEVHGIVEVIPFPSNEVQVYLSNSPIVEP